MRYIMIALMLAVFCIPHHAAGAENNDEKAENTKRMMLFKKTGKRTHISWELLAAADQFERNVRLSRRDLPKQNGLIGIYISPDRWSGPLNPNPSDVNPARIHLFGGIGRDGDGDGKADPANDEDVLFSYASFLSPYGRGLENIKIGLWDYYQRDKSVGLILGHMKIIDKIGNLDLAGRSFPVPIRYNYSYRSTWGDARGWGGRRIHEGTDIFADYGVPVLATSYGIIEMKGWNRFGGWRVGIRDIRNTYHYYGHLNGFAKNLREGMIVKPGQVIGSVGSSGYGPPGTAGKFPPHLHYGMYKDNGRTEWSFDPYPYLRIWERGDKKNKK
ncbi:peptidase M23 [Bacillus sp. SJS]|nr:peptidase M23 [Bacillus sp. SJS]